MNKETYKNIALISVFGLLWGITEAVLGSVLHFFNLPLTGLVMTFIVSLFIFPAIKLIDCRWAAIHMALIACFVKLFSIGGFKMGPVIAIGLEGVLLELLFPLFKRGLCGFIVCGIFFCLAPLLHQFIFMSFLFGVGTVEIFSEIAAVLRRIWPFFQGGIEVILWGYFIVHILSGVLAGFLSWDINRRVVFRLS